MEAWAWLLAYVVGFGLLQLLLYRYFQGDRDHAGTPSGGGEHPGLQRVDGYMGSADGGVRCDSCGTTNEHHPSISYCRACASPLH